MPQNIETLGALERRVELTVPAAEIEKEVSARLNKLSRTLRMPGFRRGKVPLKMVAASYGAQVQAEVLNDKIGQAFGAIVSASKLRVAGVPRVEPKPAGESGDVAFSATFEVYPEIRIGDLSAVEVQRAVCPVGDAEVDETIAIMRRQRATYHAVERGAVDGDRVIVDYRGSLDATPFEGGTATHFPFTVGDGRMLPEFEAAVRGMRAGESKTFPLTFPADYRAPALAGKTVQFEVTVRKVEEPKLPEVDAEFARSLGVTDGDLAKMRDEICANLEREVGVRLRNRTRESVMNALLTATSFEVPKALVQEEQRRLADMARADLAARGVQTKDSPIALELFAAQAERRVRLGLLLAELVRSENLQARQDQIRKAVEDIAQSYERPAEVIQWYLGNRERVAEVEGAVLEDNVVQWVLQRAKVVDTPVAFNELMGRSG